MIDVIIVDDEPLIRDGLVKLFSWKDYQMQVSAVFPNGALALEYLEKHAADKMCIRDSSWIPAVIGFSPAESMKISIVTSSFSSVPA